MPKLLRFTAAAALLLLPARRCPAQFSGSERDGILVIAALGSEEWSRNAKAAFAAVERDYPAELIFGPPDYKTLQAAVSRLEMRGAKKLVVVPLMAASYSEELLQVRYMLGLRQYPAGNFLKLNNGRQAGDGDKKIPGKLFTGEQSLSLDKDSRLDKTAALRRIDTKLPVVVTPALDADKRLARALEKTLSPFTTRVSSPSLVLAGMGGFSDEEDIYRKKILLALVKALKTRLRVRSADVVLFSQDRQKQEQVAKDLRASVRKLSLDGKVVVAAYSIEPDAFGNMPQEALKGTFCVWAGDVGLSGPEITDWLKSRVARGIATRPKARFTKPADSITPKSK